MFLLKTTLLSLKLRLLTPFTTIAVTSNEFYELANITLKNGAPNTITAN